MAMLNSNHLVLSRKLAVSCPMELVATYRSRHLLKLLTAVNTPVSYAVLNTIICYGFR